MTSDWYKDAIFYEVFVRAFADSNGDGIGDLPGLTCRLDYLQDLGVDCVWLLPIYPSPLRDDGYDVADFYADPSRLWHGGRLSDAGGGGAPAGPARHRRPDPQPHLGPEPLVPGLPRPEPPGARQVPGLVRLEPYRRALPGGAHHLPRL